MTTKWKLSRTKQCEKCPWKVSTDPKSIPNGYCEQKHLALQDTIAEQGALNLSGIINIMACHESKDKYQYCIGWLYNQVGVGNNIDLRMHLRSCKNICDMGVFGRQHDNFHDTLPD